MAADYGDAAQRHGADAKTLAAAGRWANSDHLAGLAAECALKAVMKGLGMPTDPMTGAPANPYKVHIDKLWPVFSAFCSGHGGSAYAAMLPAAPSPPFCSWSVNQRYDPEASISQATAEAHLLALDACATMLAQACADGVA